MQNILNTLPEEIGYARHPRELPPRFKGGIPFKQASVLYRNGKVLYHESFAYTVTGSAIVTEKWQGKSQDVLLIHTENENGNIFTIRQPLNLT